MKKHLVFCLFLLPGLIAAAQLSGRGLTDYYLKKSEICGGIDSVMKRQGSWKREEEDIISPDKTFPSNQYKLINARMDSMLSFFKEALPQLNGIEPRWYREMRGNSYITDGPVTYTFTTLYFLYYCNDNVKKILLGDETGTWAYVFVNHYNWFCTKLDDWDIENDGKKITVYSLPPKAGQWKGKTLYAPQTHTHALAVVFGHDGKLPWHSLTQKEYLEALKRKRLEEKTFDEDIKWIDNYLSRASEETLQKPAIIDPKTNALRFRGKFGDENNGGTRLVYFTTKYFKESPPRYAPQFMILYWRWTDDPVSLFLKKQFEENFPLKKLQAMIDK